MIRSETRYTPTGKEMSVSGPGREDGWAGFWDLFARRPEKKKIIYQRGRTKSNNRAASSKAKWAERKAAAAAHEQAERERKERNFSIPIKPATMTSPEQIDWARVAAMGPSKMAMVKSAAPDFL